MANIQQAAMWLNEGQDVQRKSYLGWWVVPDEPLRLSYSVVCADDCEHQLDVLDLLANDWELIV